MAGMEATVSGARFLVRWDRLGGSSQSAAAAALLERAVRLADAGGAAAAATAAPRAITAALNLLVEGRVATEGPAAGGSGDSDGLALKRRLGGEPSAAWDMVGGKGRREKLGTDKGGATTWWALATLEGRDRCTERIEKAPSGDGRLKILVGAV